MPAWTAAAIGCSNIALIKYWGVRDAALRLPANGSISMNLAGLTTLTQVIFDPAQPVDMLTLDGQAVSGPMLERVSRFLDQVRALAGLAWRARVTSANNFPMGVGIASSASAFAALALAAVHAAGLTLSEAELSRLARLGSGSACRSVPGGFVEWQMGAGDADSYAVTLAGAEHWALVDCVAIVSRVHKATGSAEGNLLAATSPLQAARLADAPRRLTQCRQAILKRDFAALAAVAELDCHLMHAVMQTSTPPLVYWQPATLTVMRAVQTWRQAGLPVFYTIDAGPNVHVLCSAEQACQVTAQLSALPGVSEVLTAPPGGPARLVEESETLI
jgi:diphosphomevalonate decarboxylase